MSTIDAQLTGYLNDAYAIERQALVQMEAAPDIAGDPKLAADFERHRGETERHRDLVRERLEQRGGSPSRVKDLVFEAGGIGFVMFAASQPDTPGKLLSHALSYEHLEQAGYELLLRVAERAGDDETARVAREIGEQERAMAERLEGSFDRAVDASLDALDPDELGEQVTKYLADAHALEQQAIELLQRGGDIAGSTGLARLYDDHLEQSREHARLLEGLLEARDSSPSRLKDAAMKLGGLNWGAFFQAQDDTPGKLAAFAHAFEFLEIGGYEQLRRVAQRAADAEVARVVDSILADERAMAGRLVEAFDEAAFASLA